MVIRAGTPTKQRQLRSGREREGGVISSEIGPIISHSWSEWDPRVYLHDYYSNVQPDEQATMRYESNTLRRKRDSWPFVSDDLVVAEVGCGPTLHHILPVAPYAKEIHMIDYLQPNLDEIKKWWKNEPGAHDWTEFTRYTLQCEGLVNPTSEDIQQREEEVRSKITLLKTADVGNKDPLGITRRGSYLFVVTAYCADSATDDKEVWEQYMRNISSLVAPGGTIMVAALRRAQFYTLGDKRFPSANITELDMHRVLGLDFWEKSIHINIKSLPGHRSQGYGGIILGSAIKK